jgi:hypothetical protein
MLQIVQEPPEKSIEKPIPREWLLRMRAQGISKRALRPV